MQTHITRALLRSGEVVWPRKDLVASFHRYKQEDAHKFLMFTLDLMQQACLSAHELLDHPSEDSTLIRQIFGGSWRSQIQCLHCLGVSDTFNPCLDIHWLSWQLKCEPSFERVGEAQEARWWQCLSF